MVRRRMIPWRKSELQLLSSRFSSEGHVKFGRWILFPANVHVERSQLVPHRFYFNPHNHKYILGRLSILDIGNISQTAATLLRWPSPPRTLWSPSPSRPSVRWWASSCWWWGPSRSLTISHISKEERSWKYHKHNLSSFLYENDYYYDYYDQDLIKLSISSISMYSISNTYFSPFMNNLKQFWRKKSQIQHWKIDSQAHRVWQIARKGWKIANILEFYLPFSAVKIGVHLLLKHNMIYDSASPIYGALGQIMLGLNCMFYFVNLGKAKSPPSLPPSY